VLAVLGALVLALGVGLPSGMDVAFEHLSGSPSSCSAASCSTSSGATAATTSTRPHLARRRCPAARLGPRPPPRGPGGALDVDRRGAFLVGLLHGTGAETPTQIALFAAAGASGSAATAAVVLGAFVAGLVLTDLGVAAAWVSGVLGSRRAPRVQLALGAVTGVASLTLGLLILTGHGGVVPPLSA
jgi:high-affinity nickel-transport protein